MRITKSEQKERMGRGWVMKWKKKKRKKVKVSFGEWYNLKNGQSTIADGVT